MEFQRPSLSVVISVYNTRETLHELYRRLGQVFKTLLPLPYEIIFVNDACHANSIDVLKEFAYNDPQVVVIDLKENVGQQQATFTGLKYLPGK